jgi:hypothetical protein
MGNPYLFVHFVITKDCILDFSIYTIKVHLIIHYLDSNFIKGIYYQELVELINLNIFK